ncbi:UDP-N-acetylmuramoyl-tripeptide--D-alanyl-D-alanine ligase [Actinocorallia herbida]|uniref:UDP-N-acetylmuramoyl-tripeptide--D-alanyl-D-alanine ligase n=1 Tax=Actinocorallia herbida TaxID=58109 RepID=A0A3N1D3G7_9ACTN|nr:UDP-N-acetylmuramoyl-tripeptide--D-alanyl-D-alanine ligase [Actinocorallia herbida]ROO88087.1 UDP-N-acetylmuramoyl-tripeptide--D-alanyl-D-alanine ligase [Actinocorallia herbida]
MIILTLGEIAEATGGTLHDVPDPDARATAPSVIDSRAVVPGGMFVAFTGARVDGHDYVPQAMKAGAVCVLATRPVDAPAVIVPDVTAALGKLAQYVLARTHATIIALTGSAGKTTTKDLLAQVLAHHGETVATQKSFNGELGLPLTVLRTGDTTRYLVLEMGARHIGDIAYLTTLTPPQIGIVLNIGTAHVGEFGDRASIAKAKSELVQALPADGFAVLNADDPLVAAMADQTSAAVLAYGTTATATIRATDITLADGRAAFTLHTPTGTAPVKLRLLGRHQIHNALAVAGAAHAVGMQATAIAQALTEAAPVSAGRLEVTERPDGVTIINDAFNANPESTRAALQTLHAVAGTRRTIAVLGEMRELGETAEAAHTEIGRLAAALGTDILITVGTGTNITALADAAADHARQPRIETTESPETLLPLLTGILEPDDTVLIKASRFVGLENFADALNL